jgi:hypothetical protein
MEGKTFQHDVKERHFQKLFSKTRSLYDQCTSQDGTMLDSRDSSNDHGYNESRPMVEKIWYI